MTPETRAALAEKLRTEAQSFVDHGKDWHVRVVARDLMRDAATEMDSVSAHVETLTQQIAHWKKLGDSVAIEDEQLQALAAELGVPKPEDRQGYTGKHTMFSVIRWLQQENARLTADRDEWMASSAGYGSDMLDQKIRAEQAEQQRDAAHAALRRFGQHEGYCGTKESWKPYAERTCTCGLDAALAASAPQKEEK